jgi:hypothetical protein
MNSMSALALYRIALACGLVPLVTGVGIFLLWLATGWVWLISAGFMTIFGGIVSVLIGAGCLVAYFLRTSQDDLGEARRFKTLVAAVVLFANFPTAGVIASAAVYLPTVYTVTIDNQSTGSLEDFRLIGGGVEIGCGTVSPGKSIQQRFLIRQDGELVLRAIRNGEKVEGRVEGYVTNGQGANMQLVFHLDGSWRVENLGRGSPIHQLVDALFKSR